MIAAIQSPSGAGTYTTKTYFSISQLNMIKALVPAGVYGIGPGTPGLAGKSRGDRINTLSWILPSRAEAMPWPLATALVIVTLVILVVFT